MSLDPKAKEWSFLSRSSCLKLNQISLQMAESHVIPTFDSSETYGNEYLELYPKIDEGSLGSQKGLALFEAGQSKGKWLTASNL